MGKTTQPIKTEQLSHQPLGRQRKRIGDGERSRIVHGSQQYLLYFILFFIFDEKAVPTFRPFMI
jgi:hypothetical protein